MKDPSTFLTRLAAFPIMLLCAATVQAQSPGLVTATNNVKAVGDILKTPSDLPSLVGGLVNVLLGAMGIVFVVLIVYAGILYMQAGTDPKNATKAKGIIINSVIGLVIVVAAYAIASFIITQISGATTVPTTTP